MPLGPASVGSEIPLGIDPSRDEAGREVGGKSTVELVFAADGHTETWRQTIEIDIPQPDFAITG